MQTIPKTNANISKFDWNFDAVPENELVACCYWEYARESSFIRDVRRRCSDPLSLEYDPWQAWWKFVGEDLERIESIGYAAEVFMRGFCYDEWRQYYPPLTRSFPDPWQLLSEDERKYRSHIRSEVEVCGLVPFIHAGDITTAEALLERSKEYSKQYRKAVDEAHAANPGCGETTLRRWGKYPKHEPKASVIWDDGIESKIVQIAWEHFTNEQIIESFRDWVKKNRPKQLKKPGKQGHKYISHRVALERLGIMRLLHRFRLADLPKQNPTAWKRYNSPNRRWRKDAQKARAYFKSLFPFLKNEPPLSWPPKD
ncbi:MAG: hypothetical protein ABSH11_05830 [Verrucomicrobiota bacterium]|jgi:hypothetical protein